jgi:hypothetical protein
VLNNIYVFKIDQNLKTGVVQTLGSQPLGYNVGETVLINIIATANTTFLPAMPFLDVVIIMAALQIIPVPSHFKPIIHNY